MRLLHTSDWHLGHQLHGVAREREHAAFLAWLVEACAREAVDALVITGDVFDGSNPPATAQAAYYRFLAEVAARVPGIQIVVLGGNHDSPARLEAPSPLLARLQVRVIGVLPRRADDPARIDWDRAIVPLQRRDGGAAGALLAVPFLRVGDLPGADQLPSASRRGPRDEGVGSAGSEPWGVAGLYAEGLEAVRARTPAGQAIVVTGHLHVSGAEASALSERRIVVGGSEAVSADLFGGDVAYVALGHLHKAQRVGGRDHVRYAGSPIPLAMNEADYRHQVLVVELDGDRAREIRALAIPRLVELRRIPRRGGASIDQVLLEIAGMSARDGEEHELRPFLEVCVRLDKPAPQLRLRIEQAVEGKLHRLVKISVERAGSGAALGDVTPGVSLAELSPRDVLVQRWRREHEGEPPAALIAAFDELVARVQERT